MASLPAFSLVMDIGSSSLRAALVSSYSSDGRVLAEAKRPLHLDAAGALRLAEVESAADGALDDVLSAALPSIPPGSSLHVDFSSLVSAVVPYGPQAQPFSHVLTYANKGLGSEAELEEELDRAGMSKIELLCGNGIPALHPAYGVLPLSALQRRTKGAVSSFSSLTSHLIRRWLKASPDANAAMMSQSEASWAGFSELTPSLTKVTDANAGWHRATASFLRSNLGLALPSIKGSAFQLHVRSDGLFLLPVSFARPGFATISFSLGLGDGAAASLASLASVAPTTSSPRLPSSLKIFGGSKRRRVYLCLTVGTSSALRGVFPIKAVVHALCGCGPDNEASGRGAVATADPSSNLSCCAACGKPSLRRLGLWCYRFCDSHVLLGGALNDGGSVVRFCGDNLGLAGASSAADVGTNALLSKRVRWRWDSFRDPSIAIAMSASATTPAPTPIIPVGVALKPTKASEEKKELPLPAGYGFDLSDPAVIATADVGAAAPPTPPPPSPPPALYFLPCLGGERSTGWDASATGQLLGLTHDTCREDILLAGMEGVSFRLRAVMEDILGIVGPADDVTILASGGALAASPLWCQLLSNALNKRIVLVEDGGPTQQLEATSRGALLFERCTRDGLDVDAVDATDDDDECLPPSHKVFTPDEAVRPLWAEAYDNHTRFYHHATMLQRAMTTATTTTK